MSYKFILIIILVIILLIIKYNSIETFNINNINNNKNIINNLIIVENKDYIFINFKINNNDYKVIKIYKNIIF